MLVSVLIPVYNVESYIEEALKSIVGQTYKNLEIIIVDDCSTDNTYAICKKFSQIDNRIKLFRNKCNKKICYTLNRAFAESSGQYIVRMDGDDVSLLDRIERKLIEFKSRPEIDILGCSVVAISEDGCYIGKTIHYSNFNFIKRTLKYVSPCSHIWMARRAVYDRLEGYRNIPGAEDYDFLLRAITENFLVSNLEDYYGYKVRLARPGNTALTFGARQRLLQKFVYKLYLQRLKLGVDEFSELELSAAIQLPKFSTLIFDFSNKVLLMAIQKTGLVNIPFRLVCLFGACLSPLQFGYLINRLRYKFLCAFYKS